MPARVPNEIALISDKPMRRPSLINVLALVFAVLITVTILVRAFDWVRNDYVHRGALAKSEVGLQIFRMYERYVEQHKRPPVKVDDLRPYSEQYPKGFEALESGSWILNHNPTPVGRSVIAFEKDTPLTGGRVFMASGVSAKMTPEELRESLGGSVGSVPRD